MKSINPSNGEKFRDYQEHEWQQVEQRLAAAEAAAGRWGKMPAEQRAARIRQAGAVLRQRKDELARLMTLEMGKPIAQSEAEVEKCARVCDYYAQNGPKFLASQQRPADAAKSYVRYDPLGPVLAVMPWNFPFWQVFRFAAPALTAGNVGLLKHASNVCGCALAIEAIFHEAGYEEGCFTTLLVPSKAVAKLIEHPVIRAATLTGSEKAGESVGAAAGRALKKSVLELGGSDPFIVLKDADVAAVARSAADARCINTGQSCIAAKRFIVEEPIADAFADAMAGEMAGRKMGDPMDRSNTLGPLARQDLVDSLHDQVQRSVAAGARLLTGGRPRDGAGFYYDPTVLSQVRPGMAAFDEETFGPVAALVRARDADEAVELANRSQYGLAASIWTADVDVAECLAGAIEAGSVFINAVVQSDPRLPFGGIKQSGYGRELSSEGIREFVNIKTVLVKDRSA